MLGLRCCGVRCIGDRRVHANWKAREDLTGIILHQDCLLDHSPRRTFSMLLNLTNQMEPLSQLGNVELPSQNAGASQASHPDAETTPAINNSNQRDISTERIHHIVDVDVHDHSEL